jgi:hypothetical protein
MPLKMTHQDKSDKPLNAPVVSQQIEQEIQRLIKQRREIDKKILSLKHSKRGIEGYLDANRDDLRLDASPLEEKWSGLREMGLTEAVRKVIQNSIEYVNAKDIRNQLATFEYPKLPKDNPLAAIHAILTRLEKNKEVRRVKGSDGKPAYEWNTPVDITVDISEAYKEAEKALVMLREEGKKEERKRK